MIKIPLPLAEISLLINDNKDVLTCSYAVSLIVISFSSPVEHTLEVVLTVSPIKEN